MTAMIVATIALAVINIVFKGAAPALLGTRALPRVVADIVSGFPPALLAGLLAVELLGFQWKAADPTVVPGLAAAAVAWRFRLPDIACVGAAVVVTIPVRLLAVG
ncbi:AzlD domain-containing protein [Naasia lichenicola]|uniref:Branched-chain amino acid ABC transporter n=1 Tax=Naasia lichenicola TaxID=2565933 RepID=A0A4S4FHP6_9MICO|nr:AzlD domain-containing protein [Naasia lichenicola]THG28655.1 branched-chain amino acid ABC transporter [Naasia lichenicola]